MGGAPVVIIVGGDTEAEIPRTMTASSIKGKDIRLRDLLGILQTSIQIESLKHFGLLQPNTVRKQIRYVGALRRLC